MEITLVVLAIVVVGVAIDAIGRLDERRHRRQSIHVTEPTTAEKIVVDLSDRDRD